MPRFTFKLASVLHHRENVEHQRQRDLAIVQAKMTDLEHQLRSLDADVKHSNDAMRQNHLVGRIDPSLLAAHRRYLAATQRRALEIAQQMATVQKSLDAARSALAAAALDRKILDKLREKQLAAWQAESARRENLALDELSTQLSYRRLKDDDESVIP
jgi:flagellar FliJ protein